MMFSYAAFNSISVISRRQLTLFMSFLGFTSTRLGSEVFCPRTLPRKNPEDLVRLEHRILGLQVKHFTTGLRGTFNPLSKKPFPKRQTSESPKLKLVVLGFNATLTAKVISWRSVTHMCFLAFSHQY